MRHQKEPWRNSVQNGVLNSSQSIFQAPMARILSLDFLAIFKVFGLDAAAAAAAAGTILDSGLAPPLTPRDGISRKGKPLAPINNTCARLNRYSRIPDAGDQPRLIEVRAPQEIS